MLRPVDLHHEGAVPPPHIQVDPSGDPAADDLTFGCRQVVQTTQGCEVELTEGVCAVRDVLDDLPDEGRATVVGARQRSGTRSPARTSRCWTARHRTRAAWRSDRAH
ncbi:hypothetical protein ASG70_04545 [Phycicoccus sp. Soil748]|nr:hypothetical protein ASG70_04545 [Phycicoccus sp. Soil748]